MRIVLAVCTYRRPEGLLCLLDSLAALAPPLPGFDFARDFAVVVVDNDAAGEGRDAAEAHDPASGFAVRAVVEAGAGISAARNRAVAEALALGPDLVAFLDDDEWPEPQWLAELVRVQRSSGADLVGGPTRSVFPEGTDERQRDNAYFGADLGIPDGAPCTLEAGGNFIARASILEPLMPDVFHPDFAHSGGEDLAFFAALARGGARMAWAAAALVHEPVASERLSRDWMRSRVINIANTRVHIMRRLDRGAAAAAVRAIKTAGLLGAATGLTIAGLVNRDLADRGRLLRWKFWGKFTAHLGRRTVRSESC